jgi:spore maturation protein CgeB
MLCQKYTITIPHDFTDMENIVYFETIDELLQKVEYLDNNPDVYTNIFEKFKKHYKAYHTHHVYCKMLLDLLCLQ